MPGIAKAQEASASCLIAAKLCCEKDIIIESWREATRRKEELSLRSRELQSPHVVEMQSAASQSTTP